MTRGQLLATICLQMLKLYQLQRLTLIVIEGQARNHTFLQQPLLMFRINVFEHQLSLRHMTLNWASLWLSFPQTHNPTRWKICDQTSNQDGTQSTWDFSPLCRAKITHNLTQVGTTSRTWGSIPQFQEKIRRTRSQGPSEFPRGEEKHVSFYHIV